MVHLSKSHFGPTVLLPSLHKLQRIHHLRQAVVRRRFISTPHPMSLPWQVVGVVEHMEVQLVLAQARLMLMAFLQQTLLR